MIAAMYLRKSRADAEAEARGEGETLARHEKILTELAHARGLTVTGIYREIVSGDTIADRPEMRRLLAAIERGEYDAVLCADIDRLGRGDGSDQATILKTLKYSGTMIVTPYKTYDPRAEIDEEYMEFAQFLARGELKRIKRRMWAGRVASAKEGKWQGRVPFGYRRVRLEGARGCTLEPDPQEAEAVRDIFFWYGKEQVGKNLIADRLNAQGFTTAVGNPFTPASIAPIICNPVYLGKVSWGKRRKHIEMRDGEEVVTRPLSDERIIVDGLHPAIISQDAWDAVAARLATQKENHTPRSLALSNPLAGLMFCAECGHAILMVPEYNRPGVQATYRCRRKGCPTTDINAADALHLVRKTLRSWLDGDPIAPRSGASAAEFAARQKMHAAACAQLEQLKNQSSRLMDLLETGVYSAETYLERSALLNSRIDAAQSEIDRLAAELEEYAAVDWEALRPKIRQILDVWESATPDELNRLLKTVVSRIIYHKTVRCYRNQNPADYLSLTIYPAT